jgi:hypothetical protein
VLYSDQCVYKINLKALIEILKFYNNTPTDGKNIFGTRSTHVQLIVSILTNCHLLLRHEILAVANSSSPSCTLDPSNAMECDTFKTWTSSTVNLESPHAFLGQQ